MSAAPALDVPGGPALRADSLHVGYGGSRVLFDVSINLPAGKMLALLGANGAGKSTLARALSGLIPVASGRIELNGANITRQSAHQRRRGGLCYIPEGRGILPGLSVIENLRMAMCGAGRGEARDAAIARAIEMFPVLGQRERQRAGSLSGGEQQMLALAGALVVRPRVIIADEMSLGLAPLVVDSVLERLEAARQAGIAVLLIEQFVHRALALADYCVILTRGRIGWAGPVGDARQQVLDRYLGEGASGAA
jgi:branched-chain amino acid transport system ATP-binding protein